VKKRLIKISIGVVLVPGFSLLLTHCSFQRYAKKSFERAKKEIPFDVIIVPGVPYQDTATNVIYKARVLWAKYLYDSSFTKNIIFSGSAVYTPYYEATTMMMYADSLGLPTENLFAEIEACIAPKIFITVGRWQSRWALKKSHWPQILSIALVKKFYGGVHAWGLHHPHPI
jgi:hypothetical protein